MLTKMRTGVNPPDRPERDCTAFSHSPGIYVDFFFVIVIVIVIEKPILGYLLRWTISDLWKDPRELVSRVNGTLWLEEIPKRKSPPTSRRG